MRKIITLVSALLLVMLCACSNSDVTADTTDEQNKKTNSTLGSENADDKNTVEETNPNIVLPDFDKQELDKMFGTTETYIVNTFVATPEDQFENYLNENKIFTKIKHYQLSDGTWMTDDHSYKYKLELKGRMHAAEKDSVFQILTNNPDITFDMAWKAYGFSSNSEDYFKVEDAVFVAVG